MIGLPADDVSRVLCNHGQGAVAYMGAIHVEDFGVAAVMADQDMVRIVLQVVLNAGAYAGKRRQVGKLAAAYVDGQNMEVLIAIEVFFEDDGMRSLPEVLCDVSF